MTSTTLEYGLEWDRDALMRTADAIRSIYWPISVFLVIPLVLFVLTFKTHMDRDCKLAFVAHNVILAIFDVYSCYFYQLYTLLPFPVFACTGILCDEHHSPRVLFTFFALFTVAFCVPYLFVAMRIHQKMLSVDSPFKLKYRSQVLLMLGFSAILFLNVYGFIMWSIESPDKDEIMKTPSFSWVGMQSRNVLVLGKDCGDIGLFGREMYLLFFSTIVLFSFYVGTTYHTVFWIGKQTFGTAHRSRSYQLQLRFMISLTIQAFFTSIMFVLPLAFLFLSLVVPLVHLFPVALMGPLRICLMVMYSCCSFGHSSVFLCKSTWCIECFRQLKTWTLSWSTNPSSASTTVRIIQPT